MYDHTKPEIPKYLRTPSSKMDHFNWNTWHPNSYIEAHWLPLISCTPSSHRKNLAYFKIVAVLLHHHERCLYIKFRLFWYLMPSEHVILTETITSFMQYPDSPSTKCSINDKESHLFYCNGRKIAHLDIQEFSFKTTIHTHDTIRNGWNLWINNKMHKHNLK